MALGYSLDELLAAPELEPSIRIKLRSSRLAISDLLERVRRELFDLRRPTYGDIKTDLESLFKSIVTSHLGYCEVENLSLSPEVHALLVRCARELLRNSVAHSSAERIWLTVITTPTHLVMTIGDDGVGGAQISLQRFGLLGIQEQVDSLGGNFQISGNHGSVATITLPLSEV